MCHIGYTFILDLIFTTETINKMLMPFGNMIMLFDLFFCLNTSNAVKFQYTEYFPTKLEILSTCCDYTTK